MIRRRIAQRLVDSGEIYERDVRNNVLMKLSMKPSATMFRSRTRLRDPASASIDYESREKFADPGVMRFAPSAQIGRLLMPAMASYVD